MKTQAWIAGAVVVLGLVLLGYMVVVEDEPGAIPLALIVGGAAWFSITRRRARRHAP